MRKLTVAAIVAASALATATIPAAAQDDLPSAVDIVIDVSGESGLDRNPLDYDLLREALVATGLVDAVSAAEDVTIFAPNDRAFKRLARDLGWEGHGEAGALAFLVTATGFDSAEEPGLLDDVLLYHVAPGARTRAELRGAGPIATLLEDATLRVRGNRIIDGDTDDRNAHLRPPSNIETSNGTVHTVSQVLRPIDL